MMTYAEYADVCRWILQTIAILFYSTREQLSDPTTKRATSDGRHINFSMDHANHLGKMLFGAPESAGGGGGAGGGLASFEASRGAAGISIWSRGKFQALLVLAMNLWEIEMQNKEVTSAGLSDEDVEECRQRVDRWSQGMCSMVDEKKLLRRKLREAHVAHAQSNLRMLNPFKSASILHLLALTQTLHTVIVLTVARVCLLVFQPSMWIRC
jgi:hypothetical protein